MPSMTNILSLADARPQPCRSTVRLCQRVSEVDDKGRQAAVSRDRPVKRRYHLAMPVFCDKVIRFGLCRETDHFPVAPCRRRCSHVFEAPPSPPNLPDKAYPPARTQNQM